jgi:DNA end-binding protein Ku
MAAKTKKRTPRAIWTGAISFGLVNVPVRMYSAIDEQDVHFHLLHEKDDSRIGYEKICKREGKPVPDDEIVKAYEIKKGEYVYVTEEDFAAAAVEGYKAIDITDFVPYEDIDPIYFERTYYLGPQDGSEKVYALLRDALAKSELAAIAKYVMRERQHLGALRVREGVITLERMYFADEIRPLDGIAPTRVKPEKGQLEMALELVERFSGKFDPDKYDDTYRNALLKVIRDKSKGKEVHAETTPEPEEAPDLMEALRASIESARARKSTKRSSSRRRQSRAPRRTAKASRR